jgi:hypothetical protein
MTFLFELDYRDMIFDPNNLSVFNYLYIEI